MLVDANTGRVDHDDIAVVSLGNRFKKSIPDTGLPPADEAIVAGGRRTIAFWNFRPRRTCSEAPEDAVQNATIIDARNSARLIRQQRRDDRPFVVGEFVTAARHPGLPHSEALNHSCQKPPSGFMSLRPRDKEAESSVQFSLSRQMLGNGVDEVIRFIGDTLHCLAANDWTSQSSGQLMSG